MDWWDIMLRLSSAVVLVIQALAMWGMWSLRKQFVARAHCDAQCQVMRDKHAKLEQAQHALPDADEVQAMAVQLAEIEGSIKAVMATVQGQAEIMTRIERPLNLLLEHHVRRPK